MQEQKAALLGVQQGFYYLNTYFLLPEGYDSRTAFMDALAQADGPLTVRTTILPENCPAGHASYELGVCYAPYFIADYLDPSEVIVIKHPKEVYPVPLMLLTQAEYNARLRVQVLAHCPGCTSFGELSEDDSTLSGHFSEITLDGFCPYRRETRAIPRDFCEELLNFGFAWKRYRLAESDGGEVLEDLKYYLKLSFASGTVRDDHGTRTLTLACKKKPTLIQTALTDMLAKFVWGKEQGRYAISLSGAVSIDEDAILAQLTDKKIAATRKELSRYGVSLAIFDYDPTAEASMQIYLNTLIEESMLWPLVSEPGKVICLLTSNHVPMRLRSATPVLKACNTQVTLYTALKTERYAINYTMEPITLDVAPAPAPAARKPDRKWQKAEEGRVLNRDQALELFIYLENNLSHTDCDHTLHFTGLWLIDHFAPDVCRAAIEEIQSMGGFCDCEVLMNCYEDYELDGED